MFNTKTKTILVGLLGLTALFVIMPGPASADLPPRPTQQPTAIPAPNIPISGASIELRVPTTNLNYYTLVQWQDVYGLWHTVESWQGNLDDTVISAGLTVAYKRWWVYTTAYGQENFRWQVYDRPNGKVLVTSGGFNLPTRDKQDVITYVTLP